LAGPALAGEPPSAEDRARAKARAERTADLLSAIEGGPEFVLPALCTLTVESGRSGAWRRLNDVQDLLPAGTRVRPMALLGNLMSVKTRDAEVGQIHTERVQGLVPLQAIPRIDAGPPVIYADVTGDGTRDLVNVNLDCVDGSDLRTYSTPGSGYMGICGNRLVVSAWAPTDSLWFYGLGGKGGRGIRLVASANRACDLENSFVYAKRKQVRDSTIRLYGVDRDGVAWMQPIPSRPSLFYIYQAGSMIYIGRPYDMHLVSASDGRIIWQETSVKPDWDAGVVFFCRDGFAVRKTVWGGYPADKLHHGDGTCKSPGSADGAKGPKEQQRLVFRDWQGKLIFDILIPCRWHFPFPPSEPGSLVWGRHAQMRETHEDFCPRTPVNDTRYLPVVTDDSVVLTSTADGSRYRFYIGGDNGFHGYTWSGAEMDLPDVPGASYPIWDGDRVAFLASGLAGAGLLNAEAAEQVARKARAMRSGNR